MLVKLNFGGIIYYFYTDAVYIYFVFLLLEINAQVNHENIKHFTLNQFLLNSIGN